MKVAIVHDYLNSWGGAEKLVSAIHELFPHAPIYTSLFDKSLVNKVKELDDWKVIAPSWLQGRIFWRFPKYFTAMLPLVFESFDLSGFDLVISSSAAFAKGIITGPRTMHINYCHTPPRFLYGYKGESDKRTKWYWKIILKPLDSVLRIWDYCAAQRPDFIICNSLVVKERIWKYYRREAHLIYPPIDLPSVDISKSSTSGEYFLVVSRLSAFKNIGIIIEACGKLGVPLKIAGTGREEKNLRRIAEKYSNIEFLGFVNSDDLEKLYTSCKAFICATVDEDFGMTVVEANAYGKPVIALKSGGVIEALKEGESGVFFDEPTVEGLLKVLSSFRPENFAPEKCRLWAENFSKNRFQRELYSYIESKFQGNNTYL